MPAKNPLFEALKRKSYGPEPKPMPMPRIIELNRSEIKAGMPGDPVKVEITGIITSVNDEGKVLAKIVLVEDCMNEDDEDKEEEKPRMVMTQESHTP